MTAAHVEQSKPAPLPRLREDLQIIPGRVKRAGGQSWRVYDPIQHRFIEIDETTFKILSLWQTSTDVAALTHALQSKFDLTVDGGEIARLAEFVYANHLAAAPPGGDWKAIARQVQRSRESGWQWLLHNYLFFKIPIFRPQSFLAATLPVVEPFFSRGVQIMFAVMGIAGLYLVSRQWDQFINTFQHFFTLQGAAIFACALFAVKALHELGHAYMAVRLGCQVPAMGVAFMVMTPMLYTDVTDAWRLKSRRQRMAIDIAGVAVELMIASSALFAWTFLEPGSLRSLAFVLATSSIVTSLAINLSPFMRFDGYFILSDLVAMPNLQPRAFAVARWHLREVLFGLHQPCPENVSKAAIAALTVYSWATWVYRLILYFGIALVVYHCFFKLLGIFLFFVEVGFFILLPFYREFSEWRNMKTKIFKSRRWPLGAAGLASLLLAAVIPWSTRVSIPVVVEPGELARVFASSSGIIQSVEVKQGDWVEAGKVLATLKSPVLDRDLRRTELSLQKTRAQLARLTADDADRENRVVLLGELATATQKLKGLQTQQSELQVRAPLTGRLVELNPSIRPGRPWNARELLAAISSEKAYIARGYIGEHDIWRISKGNTGRIVPDSIARGLPRIAVEEISPTGASVIDVPELTSVYGGKVAVQPDAQRRLVPTEAQFFVKLALLDSPEKLDVRYRGVAQLDGEAESFAASLFRQVYRVLLREAGA